MAQQMSIAVEELAEHADDLVAELQAGHTLKLVHGNKRIAEIVPSAPEPTDEQRKAAWAEMLEIMRRGVDLGGVPFTRDEMHER